MQAEAPYTNFLFVCFLLTINLRTILERY